MSDFDNATSTPARPFDYGSYARAWVNMLQGLFMVLCNGLILASVARAKFLREKKEVVVLCLLVLSDLLYGLPTFYQYALGLVRLANLYLRPALRPRRKSVPMADVCVGVSGCGFDHPPPSNSLIRRARRLRFCIVTKLLH